MSPPSPEDVSHELQDTCDLPFAHGHLPAGPELRSKGACWAVGTETELRVRHRPWEGLWGLTWGTSSAGQEQGSRGQGGVLTGRGADVAGRLGLAQSPPGRTRLSTRERAPDVDVRTRLAPARCPHAWEEAL